MEGASLAFIIEPASDAARGLQGIPNDFEFSELRWAIKSDKAMLFQLFHRAADSSRTLPDDRWDVNPIDTAMGGGIPNTPKH